MAEVVFMAISVFCLWEDEHVIVIKLVEKPHDCREDLVRFEFEREQAGQAPVWFGTVVKCHVCDAHWEKRENQRDGVYWAKIVEGTQPAVFNPGGPVRPLRYPQLPASDKRNDPRWFHCQSDACSAFGEHMADCTSKLNSDGKVV